MSKQRKKLLLRLANIIGLCYNKRSANWGPNYQQEAPGREFIYPIYHPEDQSIDPMLRQYLTETSADWVLMDAVFPFGANHLYVIRNLDKILKLLEKEYGLKIEEEDITDS